MNIIVETDDDTTVAILSLSGRFDAHMAPRVSTWLKERTSSHAPRLILDLGGVTFIDSVAMGALIQGMKRARQQGGDLILYGLQQPVRIIFELTRMDRAFSIYESREQALNAFAQGAS